MTDSSYRLVHQLGIGGMASVYAAERTRSDGSTMPVACKYMRADLRDHPRLVALFYQEAALGLALSPGHDGLVTILECFQDADENLCLVMELVDGCTLRDLLDVRGPLPHAAVRAIARHLLSALAYLHERGVVHRDVSPCNVLLSLGGEVKLSDLGLAKLLGSGAGSSGCFRGKPAYASPEQLAGRKVDVRSDLFSLGVVLYRMLTGRMPFGSEGDVDATLERILEGPPELPSDVPADLRGLTLGVLAAAPEARTPASADAALAGLAAGRPADASVAASVASDIELAALVIEARSRHDPEQTASPGAVETPSSSALTQSWSGPARPRRRARRLTQRRLLGVLLGLAVLLALLGVYRVRGLLEPSTEPAAVRPEVPAPIPAGPPGPPGPGDAPATVAPERAARDVQMSGQAAEPASRPRVRTTARRVPARYFAPRGRSRGTK
jgi:eukaryotic-like serine/threonine-protein kinase